MCSSDFTWSNRVFLIVFLIENEVSNLLDQVKTNLIFSPCRMTLLLGPPGAGKTTLLLALAGKLDKSLRVSHRALNFIIPNSNVEIPKLPNFH